MWDQFYIKHKLLANTADYRFVEVPREVFRHGILIVPGRFHYSQEDHDELRRYLEDRDGVILFVTSDEESSLDFRDLKAVRKWIMTPPIEKLDRSVRQIGSLPTPAVYEAGVPVAFEQKARWTFAGQITTPKRKAMAQALRERHDGYLAESPGFTQGLEPRLYMEKLARARLAPCPPGAVKPDSFRFYEALEMGCVPILDKNDAVYWRQLFGKPPPVRYTDGWDKINDVIDVPPDLAQNNRVFAWWQRTKHDMQEAFLDDLRAASLTIPIPACSFLVPVSPIRSHPSTEILDETVHSIQERAPYCPIYLMFDGVREQQREYRDTYQLHIRRMLIKHRDNTNIIPVVMDRHCHQAVMTRKTIQMVRTPLICFVEQDTPLIGEIDFDNAAGPILRNELDMLRFHHEAQILDAHEHLMIDHYSRQDYEYRRTVQWSQRPHLARTNWYRNLLNTYFGWRSRTMIEDLMHSVVLQAWENEGMKGWEQFRIAIYTPRNDSVIKRSTHLDGREGDPKFGMKIAFDGLPPQYAGQSRVNE